MTKSLMVSQTPNPETDTQEFWQDAYEDVETLYYQHALETAFPTEKPSTIRRIVKRIQNFKKEHPTLSQWVDQCFYSIGTGLQYSAYATGMLGGFVAGEVINPLGGGAIGAPLGLAVAKSSEASLGYIVQYGLDKLSSWYENKGRTISGQLDRKIAFQQFTQEVLPLVGLLGMRGVRTLPSKQYLVVYNSSLPKSLLPTPFSKLSRQYIMDMETRSGIKIGSEQRSMLEQALRTQKFEKLLIAAKIEHTKQYQKMKNHIISEWELNTKQKWPIYKQDILSKDGGVLFPTGSKVQAHHIIHQSHGGPHVWWNVHPLQSIEHQTGVHKLGSPGEILHGKK